MSDNDLPDFAVRLEKLVAGLGGPALKSVMVKAGMEGKEAAAAAGRADLGADGRFSGWPKAALAAKWTDHSDGLGLTMHREPKSAGPFRVAEFGRNQGSGFAGPGVNSSTGMTKKTRKGAAKVRSFSKWNGRTKGKGTWSDAEAIMGERIPVVVEAEVLKLMMGWVNGK